jgi:hypothetical protein
MMITTYRYLRARTVRELKQWRFIPDDQIRFGDYRWFAFEPRISRLGKPTCCTRPQ